MSVQERPDELIRLLRPEFAGRTGADSPASLTWGKIMLIPPAGAPVTTYPVTVAGLLAALSAATVAGSMIWVPPGSFNTAIIIPANIALVALGEKVSINGQWTLNSGVVVANIVQTQSGSSAGALSGVVGPSSGIAYMKNCSISVENSGAGDAYAINQSGAASCGCGPAQPTATPRVAALAMVRADPQVRYMSVTTGGTGALRASSAARLNCSALTM